MFKLYRKYFIYFYVYIFRPQLKKIVSSFFALIRDIICANWDYRMDMTALNERVHNWVNSTINNRKNPDWYHSLTLKTWPKSLQSAIGFLAGHFPGKFVIMSLHKCNN